MKGYKLIEEGKAHFHLEHPNGSRFSIAKSGIDAATTKRLKAMPAYDGGVIGMADGGMVKDENKPDPKEPKTISLNEEKRKKVQASMNNAFGFNNGGMTGDEPTEDQIDDNEAENAPDEAEVAAPAAPMGQMELPASELGGGIPTTPAGEGTPAAAIPGFSQMAPNAEFPPEAPAAPIAPAAGASPVSPASNGLAQYGDIGSNLKQQIEATKAIADAKAKEALQVSGAYGSIFGNDKAARESIDQQKTQLKDLSLRRADIQAQNEALFKDIQTDKVNPSKLWDNMSTASKITAGISMILGGAASGITGRPNAALEVMNKAVDNDIEAQKANINKKSNLLAQNMTRYHDLGAAETATRLNMNTALQAQIASISARTGSALAKAQGDMAIGQLKMQAVPMMQNLAKWQVESKSLGAGGQEGGIPISQEPVGLLSDPKYQRNRVVVNGRAYQGTGTRAELESMRLTERHAGPVINLIKQLDGLGKEAVIPGTDAYNMAHAIRAKLATEIPQLAGIRNINLQEIEHAGDQVRDPTKFSQLLTGGVKNNQFFKNVTEEMESQRKQHLMGYKGMASIRSRKGGWE